MRWRSLPAVLVLAVLASALAPEGQLAWKTHRIGVLSPGSICLTTSIKEDASWTWRLGIGCRQWTNCGSLLMPRASW